jgi:hypothetical protein
MITQKKSWAEWFFHYWVLPWNTGWQWRKQPIQDEEEEC